MNTGLLTFFAILVIIVLGGVCIALVTNKKINEDTFVSQPITNPITNPISNNDVQLYMISLDRIRDKRADKSLPLLKKIFPKGTRFSAVDVQNIDISDPRFSFFNILLKLSLEFLSIAKGETATGNGFKFPLVISTSIKAKALIGSSKINKINKFLNNILSF